MMDVSLPSRSRANAARLCALLCVVGLLFAGTLSTLAYEPVGLGPGTVDQPANGSTVVSVQGFNVGNEKDPNKPARVLGVGPAGHTKWRYDGTTAWYYDVDPLASGSLLVSGTSPGSSTVFAWNPATREREWAVEFDLDDTHDVDRINGDELLVANMRNYNGSADRNDDRLFVYNRTREAVVWEFRFERIYDRGDGGDYTGDWTHVNDVDKIGEGLYMASPRNMDEVVVVNRSTKEVELRLGSDDDHGVLYEQHNPTYLTGENGTPTVLVADSENDRVVEYARTNGSWERTWTLGVGGRLNWPRDADRLPNGNTLVVDSLNHRVIEVTPQGRVVWEYYAPWAPYDAERVGLGDEPGGPTVREQNATGSYAVTGSAGRTLDAGEGETFDEFVTGVFAGTPVSGGVDWLTDRWAHVAPFVRPAWVSPWGFVYVVTAALVALLWGLGELVVRRRRVWRRVRRLGSRLRRAVGDGSAPPDNDDGTFETDDGTPETETGSPDGDADRTATEDAADRTAPED